MSWWDCMRWWNTTWDGTMPWPMFLPMLMIGAIIIVVMLLTRGGKTAAPPTWRDGRRQTPFEILSERFARGEIDRQEYEERKGLLSQP